MLISALLQWCQIKRASEALFRKPMDDITGGLSSSPYTFSGYTQYLVHQVELVTVSSFFPCYDKPALVFYYQTLHCPCGRSVFILCTEFTAIFMPLLHLSAPVCTQSFSTTYSSVATSQGGTSVEQNVTPFQLLSHSQSTNWLYQRGCRV